MIAKSMELRVVYLRVVLLFYIHTHIHIYIIHTYIKYKVKNIFKTDCNLSEIPHT